MSHTVYRDSRTLLVPNGVLAYDPIAKGPGYTFYVSYFERTADVPVSFTLDAGRTKSMIFMRTSAAS